MDSASEKALMQKILECVEAQVEVLKKTISQISKMEEEKDEEAKANYGQSELTQEDIDHMMTKGKICLLLPNFMAHLKSTPRPWTFKRAHVNDFFESGDAGSQEDHDWSEWTSKVGTTRVTPAHFMLEHNIDPSSNDDQYLVLTQGEDKEEGDEVISYWSEDDNDCFFDEVGRDFANEGKALYDITKATHIQKPLKEEDWSAKLKNLFEEADEGKNDKP